MNTTLVLAGFFDQGFFRGLLVVGIAFCWGFALYDLVTRPMSGFKKAIWLVVILILPILGTVIYLVAQPLGGAGSSPGVQALAQRDVDQAIGEPPRRI